MSTVRFVESVRIWKSPERHLEIVEIERPSPELLKEDPAMARGFQTLGRRVLIQAFEDAVRGNPAARAFLTTPEEAGTLNHWRQQAGLPVPLGEFCRLAARCLNNPRMIKRLFPSHTLHLAHVAEKED